MQISLPEKMNFAMEIKLAINDIDLYDYMCRNYVYIYYVSYD